MVVVIVLLIVLVIVAVVDLVVTIKGSYRRAEKSRKVLMMMKAAKLGWVEPEAGQEQGRSRALLGQEQARSRPGAGQEQARRQARAWKKQELGRSMSMAGAGVVQIPNFILTVLKPRS